MSRRKRQGVPPRTQEPRVEVRDVPVENHTPACGQDGRPQTWPEDQPLPEFHDAARVQPCPACRRLRLQDGGQAVAVSTSGYAGENPRLAHYRCRACGHRWCLPWRS
jgi:hypothetical protein